jgi:hypothetical protein
MIGSASHAHRSLVLESVLRYYSVRSCFLSELRLLARFRTHFPSTAIQPDPESVRACKMIIENVVLSFGGPKCPIVE